MLEPITLNTIPNAIVQQIKDLVMSGRLKPGDRLPTERELSDQFGVGRSSVREAMMALSAMGLVVRQREGTFVNPDPFALVWSSLGNATRLTPGSIADVLEARRIFEVGIATLAAARASAADIAEVRRHVPDRLANADEFRLTDFQFHAAIARAAGNPFVQELYAKVQETLFQTHQYYTALEEIDPHSATDLYASIVEEHRAIVSAIEAHDPDAAAQAMMAHFEAIQSRLVPVWETEHARALYADGTDT